MLKLVPIKQSTLNGSMSAQEPCKSIRSPSGLCVPRAAVRSKWSHRSRLSQRRAMADQTRAGGFKICPVRTPLSISFGAHRKLPGDIIVQYTAQSIDLEVHCFYAQLVNLLAININ